MSTAKLTVWVVSLALQSVLLVLLVRRGIARALPVFTALIGFYVVRSSALFVVSRSLGQASYTLLFSGLAVTDVLVQCFVAWELSRGVKRRAAVFGAIIVAAGAMAWGIASVVPANLRVPMDRGVVFTAVLFLLVFAVASYQASAPLFFRVRAGFAVYGAAALSGQIGRTLAAVHRDARGFQRWSYVETVCYLAVIVWWMGTLPGVGVYASTCLPPAGAGSRSTGSTVAPAS